MPAGFYRQDRVVAVLADYDFGALGPEMLRAVRHIYPPEKEQLGVLAIEVAVAEHNEE